MTEDTTESGKHWAQSVANAVNGKPLDTMSWVGSVITVAPGYHRIKNAIGLSVGLYLGRKFMNIVTAQNKDGEIAREEVPLPLRPLHGLMRYNKYSDDPRDRWCKVVDNVVPAMFGAVGAVGGSFHFFHERYADLKNPEFMDEYEEAMSLEQSKPWSVLSGISSLFGSASGLSLGPAGNYGLSLGARFGLASGRKVALPGLGKFATNAHAPYPFGPSQLIDRMIGYAVGNPDKDPKQLESMAHGILGPWFKNVTPDQIHAFVDAVKGMRDQFLQEGGIPEEMQGKAKTFLTEHLKKGGLEETLKGIGLDPMDASLGDNGFVTAVSKLLGKRERMAEMGAEFTSKYMARHNGGDVAR